MNINYPLVFLSYTRFLHLEICNFPKERYHSFNLFMVRVNKFSWIFTINNYCNNLINFALSCCSINSVLIASLHIQSFHIFSYFTRSVHSHLLLSFKSSIWYMQCLQNYSFLCNLRHNYTVAPTRWMSLCTLLTSFKAYKGVITFCGMLCGAITKTDDFIT